MVDDLQDYLVYFSSRFLISLSNSSDLIKELWASCNGPKYLSVCWGTLVTCLVIARKIVEHNFWPHLFRPAIHNLVALPRLGQPQSFVLPQVPLNKSSTTASAYISSSQIHTPPFPADFPSQVQCLPLFNVQCELPQMTPSKANPTVGKEDHPSSLTLDTSPTLSGLHPTRIPLDCRPSNVLLKSPSSQVYEDCLDEDFAPPNHTITMQRPCSSTPDHAGETRELGNLEDNAKLVGHNEQATEEVEIVVEEEGVFDVPCTLSLTAVSRPMSAAPYTIDSAAPHQGPSILLPRPNPLPYPFANAIPQPSPQPTRFPSKGQCTERILSSVPIRSPSATQKRLWNTRTRRFPPLHAISPTIRPFQRPAPPLLHPSTPFPSVVPLKPCFPRKCENHPDQVSPPLNNTFAPQCFHSSAPAHANGTWKPETSKGEVKVGEVDKQDMREMEVAAEREGVTTVPCTHLPPIQLTSFSGNAARELDAVSTRTPSASSFSSGGPYIPNSTANLHQQPTLPLPHSALHPCSFANAISRCSARFPPNRQQSQHLTQHPQLSTEHSVSFTPHGQCISNSNLHQCWGRSIPSPHSYNKADFQSSTCSTPSSTSRFTSAAPLSTVSPSSTTSQPTTNLHSEPTMPLPRSIPLPHSFAKAIPRHPACLSPKRRHAQQSVSDPLYFPSISPTPARDFYYSSSLHSQPSMHFSSKRRCSSLPRSFCQLENTRNEHSRTPSSRGAPPIRHEGFTSSLMPNSPYSPPCQDEQRPSKEPLSPILMDNASDLFSPVHGPHSNSPLAVSRNYPASLHSSLPSPLTLRSHFPQNAVRCFYNSNLVRTGKTREPGQGKDDAKAVRIDEQVSREAEVAPEGKDVVVMQCAHPLCIPLTPIQAEAAVEHIAAVPAWTLAPATTSWINSIAPCISNSTPSPFQGSSTPVLRSFTNANPHTSSVPTHSRPAVQKQPLRSQLQRFVSSPPPTPSLQQRLPNVSSASLPSYACPPCQVEQLSPGGPRSSITADNSSNTSLSVCSFNPLSPPTLSCERYLYLSSLMPSESYSLPKTNQPSHST